MRTWARMVAAVVTLVAGAVLFLTEVLNRGLSEDEGPDGSNLVLAIAFALLALGAAGFFTSWAVGGAAVLLGVVVVYGWSGDVPGGAGEVYAVISVVALLALGALACFRRRGRGTLGAHPASPEAPAPPAPSAAPSTPGAEQPHRTPPS